MWKFSYKHGWSEVEDFLAYTQRETGSIDLSDDIRNAGYEPADAMSLGNMICGDVIMEVYIGRPDKAHYAYLVELDLLAGCDPQFVALKTFPDLIELINKILPIAVASGKIHQLRSSNGEPLRLDSIL
jgi:hypothetical protein